MRIIYKRRDEKIKTRTEDTKNGERLNDVPRFDYSLYCKRLLDVDAPLLEKRFDFGFAGFELRFDLEQVFLLRQDVFFERL